MTKSTHILYPRFSSDRFIPRQNIESVHLTKTTPYCLRLSYAHRDQCSAWWLWRQTGQDRNFTCRDLNILTCSSDPSSSSTSCAGLRVDLTTHRFRTSLEYGFFWQPASDWFPIKAGVIVNNTLKQPRNALPRCRISKGQQLQVGESLPRNARRPHVEPKTSLLDCQ
jgi:hypothetical protein